MRNRRKVQQRIAMGQVRADVKSDDWGRWAVRGIMAVPGSEAMRGGGDDRLRFRYALATCSWSASGKARNSDGDLWEESWVSVTGSLALGRPALLDPPRYLAGRRGL